MKSFPILKTASIAAESITTSSGLTVLSFIYIKDRELLGFSMKIYKFYRLIRFKLILSNIETSAGTCPNRIGPRNYHEIGRVFSNLDFVLLREP